MSLRLLFLFAAFSLLTCCEQSDYVAIAENRPIASFSGHYTSSTSSGKVDLKLYAAVGKLLPPDSILSRDISVKGGPIDESFQRGGDPIPFDDECWYFFGPKGNGNEDAVDCVSNVWNSFFWGEDGNCLDEDPCRIMGSIYGRSKLHEECFWELEGFDSTYIFIGNGFVFDFDATMDCGGKEIIKVKANGTTVDKFEIRCDDCALQAF